MKQKLKKIFKYWLVWIAVNYISWAITESALNLACYNNDVDPDDLEEREGFVFNLGIIEAFYNIKKVIKVMNMK